MLNGYRFFNKCKHATAEKLDAVISNTSKKARKLFVSRKLGCNYPKPLLNLELYTIFKIMGNHGLETILMFRARPD